MLYFPSKCQAYKCEEYYNLVNDTYCMLHHQEICKLKESSDDFKSKIQNSPQRSNDTKCRTLNCTETSNLVEDFIMLDGCKVYGKWCINHHNLHVKELMYFCDFINCQQTNRLTQTKTGIFCRKHYKQARVKNHIKIRVTCNIDGCNKTARLILSKDKYWCKKHFNLQPDPEIFPSTEKKKYKWLLNKNNLDSLIEDEEIKVIVIPKKSNVNIYKLLNKCQNTNNLSLCNDQGKEMCHAYECKIYKQLYEKYKGKWCPNHCEEITELRTIINKHDGSKKELEARLKELQLRKFPDINHWKWALKLLRCYYK